MPVDRAAVARLEAGESRGTGVLVRDRANRGDLVLTALHVVFDRRSGKPYASEVRVIIGAHVTLAKIERSDVEYDWVLLRCAVPPPSGAPLPMHAQRESGVAFESFGFPDAQPVDGLDVVGEVRNARGQFFGTRALQLYCVEAAAGAGLPVSGFSGAPCVVDGALIGILRASLMQGDTALNVGGTLYACPVAVIAERCSDVLDWPDPCAGLPGARGLLPQEPFRYLAPYDAGDARIFSGRCRELKLILARLAMNEGPRLLVIHGESGVGKSSLLHAGLLPRWKGTSRYGRRDAEHGLRGTLRTMLGPDPTAKWRAEEAQAGVPLLVVIDQIDEAWTRPISDQDEVGELLATLAPYLTSNDPPSGALVLSVRKEWATDLFERLSAWHSLRWEEIGVARLDREAIVEIVTALTPSGLLGDHYRLRVEPESLAATIATDLLQDPLSPVAPVLQILLTRMWEEAKKKPHTDGMRIFSSALYEYEKVRGYHLHQFVDQQLQTLEAEPSFGLLVRSGLVLDLLEYHLTELESATTRTREVLYNRYGHHSNETLDSLVARLTDLYLLASASGGTRLAHDTLGPHIRARFVASQSHGQRARRIIESRGADWRDGATGAPLDERDFELVQLGLAGMRGLEVDEERLINASKHARARSRRLRRTAYATLGVLALLSVSAVTMAIVYQRSGNELSAVAGASRAAALAGQANNEAAALVQAIGAHQLSRGASASVQRQARLSLSLALSAGYRARAFEAHLQHVNAVAFAPDSTRLASGGDDNQVVIWDLPSGRIVQTLNVGAKVWGLAFAPDGSTLAVATQGGEEGRVATFEASTYVKINEWHAHDGASLVVAFSPDSDALVTGGADGRVKLWKRDGTHIASVIAVPGPAVYALALTRDPINRGHMILASGGDGGDVTVRSGATLEKLGDCHPMRLVHSDKVDVQERSVRALAFSHDSTALASAGWDGSVALWKVELSAGALPVTEPKWRAKSGALNGVTFLSNGDVAVGGWDKQITVYSATQGASLRSIKSLDAFYGIAASPDGKWLAGASWDRTVRVYGSLVEDEIRTDTAVRALTISKDGKRLVTGGADGSATVWEMETTPPTLLKRVGLKGYPLAYAELSRDTQKVVTVNVNHQATVWWLLSGESKTLPGAIDYATFSPDGLSVAATQLNSGAKARILDIETGEAIQVPEYYGYYVSATYTEDGRLVAFGSADRKVQIVTAAAPNETLTVLDDMTGIAHAVAFAPDNDQVVAVGASDSRVRLCTRSGHSGSCWPLIGHADSVGGVAFSADGKLLFSAGTIEGAIRIWDVENTEALVSFDLTSRFGTSGDWRASMSSDGSWIAATDATDPRGTVKVIHTDDASLRRAACELLRYRSEYELIHAMCTSP